MRPSFPTPQGLQSVRHPSKFLPRRERIRGTIQVRLSFTLMDSGLIFRSYVHITILPDFACVMNIWDQTRQTFVTGFGPFCDRSCKFVCWRTIEYQVFQYVPNINILEQFESTLLAILLQNSFLLLWNDGRQGMELILCRVVESSCLSTHNIVPHTSLHDLPYHKTMKNYEDSQSTEAFFFCSAPLKFDLNMIL